MSDSLEPRVALLLYGERGTADLSHAVLSIHGITHGDDDAPLLDAGRVLTEVERQLLIEALIDPASAQRALRDVALIPETLLRETSDSLTWYRPAARTTMYWRTSKCAAAITAVLPTLVFHVQSGALAVAASADPGRPTERTPLYAVPLGNVFADTRVCVGNASLPTSLDRSTMAAWERVLLSTNYSHVNHPQTLAGGATTESLIAFWQKRKARQTPPAARYLSPLHRHLKEWVSSLAKDQAE